MDNFQYSGNELDVFAAATNWKKYWSDEIGNWIGERVLEVGAGIGSTFSALPARNYSKWVALEPDEKQCAVIMRTATEQGYPPSYEVRQGFSSDLDANEVFDTILYVDVLEHIEDDATELLQIQRNLQVGGRIIIVAPAHNFLFTPFDSKIGHFRRYDKNMLISIAPPGLHLRKLRYLDCIGLLASLGNRLVLRSEDPTPHQIRIWDRYMVSSSRICDRAVGYRIGKSIICVLEKTAGKSENSM